MRIAAVPPIRYLGADSTGTWLRKGDLHARWLRSQAAEMVGPPGFEPGSNRPKRSSMDQTNPRALMPFHRKGSHEGY